MRLVFLFCLILFTLTLGEGIVQDSASTVLTKSIRDLEYKTKIILENPSIQSIGSWVTLLQTYYEKKQFSTQQLVLPTSGSGTPTHEWPTNILDIGAWIGYGVFLIIIFILPILLCCSLCCNMCCLYWGRCCGLCGGRKIKSGEGFKGYKTPERLCILPPYVIVFAIITIAAIASIVFTVAFVETGRVVTRASQQGVEDGFGFIGTVRGGMNSLFEGAGDLSGKASNAISGIGGVSGIITNIINILGTVGPVVTNMKKEFDLIQGNLTDITNINRGLQSQPGLSGVPANSEVPDLSATRTALESAETTVTSLQSTSNQLQSQTNTAIGSAQGAIDGVSTSILASLTTAKTSANQAFDSAEALINQTVPKSTRDQVFYYFELVETLWTVIFAVLYAIPSLILCWGILYIIIGKFPLNWCFKFGACYLFLFFGIYILLFDVQLIASILLGHTCTRVPRVVNSLDVQASNFGVRLPISTPLGNISISAAVNGLANCDGRTTLFDAVGVSLDSLNITQRFDEILRQVNETIKQFNVSGMISQANSQTNSFNLDVFNIATDYSTSIGTYKTKVADVQAQLSDLSRFGFNQSDLDGHFFQLNNESINLTPSGQVFGESNISLLIPANAPYNQKQQYFTDKKQVILVYIDIKKNATDTANAINANITIIYNDLSNIQASLNNTLSLKSQITSIPGKISAEVNKVADLLEQVKTNCTNLVGDVRGLFLQALDTLYTLTSCKKVGDYYRDQLQTNLCTTCYTLTILACIASVILGVGMCALYPICLSSSKRVGNPYQNLAQDEWKNAPPIDKVQPLYGPPPQTQDMVPIPSHEPPKDVQFEPLFQPTGNPNEPPMFSPESQPGQFEPIPEFVPIHNDLDATPIVVHEDPIASPNLTQHDVQSMAPEKTEAFMPDDDYHPPPPPVESPRDYKIAEIVE